jgi:Uma2 family endonuclease
MIELMTLELNMAMMPGGSTAFRRELMEKGLEPDECYWIANAASMQGKLEFDADTDPPPDLALEIDIIRSSLNRMGIYAALGTRELWRFDGESLTVHHLVGAKYRVRDRSRAFPFLLVQELLRFVKQAETEDQTTVMRAFTQWVRETLLPAAKPSKSGKSSKNNGKSAH